MSITINPEIESMIQSFLGSGAYQDINEVLKEALQLLQEREESSDWSTEALRKELEIGLDDIRNGRVSHKSVDEMAEEALEEYRQKNETR